MFAFVVAFTKPAVNKEVFVSVLWHKWMRGLFKFRFSVFDPSDSTVAVIKRFLTVTRWFSSCILENFWSLHIFIDNFHPPYSNSCCVSFLFVNLKEKANSLGPFVFCLFVRASEIIVGVFNLNLEIGISLQAFSFYFWFRSESVQLSSSFY